MSEEEIQDISRKLAPALLMLWVQFHHDNELIECVLYVNTEKFNLIRLPTMTEKQKALMKPKNPFMRLK